MKIEINIASQYLAVLNIDGRELHIRTEGCETTLHGVKAPESANTLGGMVAASIYGKIHDIGKAIQAVRDDSRDGTAPTWKKLKIGTADAVYDLVS